MNFDYFLAMAPLYAVSLLLSASCFLVLRCGELSFGQQAYFGCGAYTCGILTAMFDWTLVPALATSAAIGGVVAGLSGLAALRMSGFQFSLFTLVFGEFVREALARLQWRQAAASGEAGPEGPLGFSGIEHFRDHQYSVADQALLTLGIALAVMLAIHALDRSRWGRIVDAVAADRVMAESVGVPAARVRLATFVAAGGIAALGGALFALTATYIDAANFGLMMGVHALAYTLLGGLASVAGPVIGTAVDILLLEGLRIFGSYRMVAFGTLIVLALILRPQGLLGGRRPPRAAS